MLFGDNAEVDGYYGLENYTANHINGYLHITFTYTHNRCCFASYPPALYVTASDPRATSTPTVKELQPVYHLLPIPIPPGHDTDWYLYDVQFDSLGYRVLVKQKGEIEVANFHRVIAGLVDTDWAALANQHPFQPNYTLDQMAFTPLPIYENVVPPEPVRTPVIIVPGIMGSKLLNSVNSEVWPAGLLLVSPLDLHLNQLEFLSDGVIPSSDIQVGSLIKSLGDTDFFLGLVNLLESEGYGEDTELFLFSYDWRRDILGTSSDSEVNQLLSLKEKIEEVKTLMGVEEVNLIGHSMGGLLVKKYLKDYGGGSVDKFIDVGTPHIGSPKAFKILNYGDNLDATFFFNLLGLNSERVKIISQNMPAIYQLLPSQKYFDSADSNYYVFDGVNNSERLNFNQTKDYMASQGRNSVLVERADAFHQEIDSLNPADYGVETYNFVGCGTPTIGNFYLLEGGEHPIYNIKMINGDGTVPIKSAEAMTALKTYYVKNAQHALMPSTSGVKDLIAEILTSTSTEFDISPYSNLALSADNCTIPNGKIVSFHSPIELHVYDSFGNHSGPDTNGDIENELGGVIYEVIGDNKFAFLPNGIEYTVKGNATDIGTFDTRIQELVNGEVATTTIFADIPLTLTTQVRFTLGSGIPSQITLDHNNDGTFELNQGVSTTTSGILESTGKITAVAAKITEQVSSSRPVATSTLKTIALEIATSTEEVISKVPAFTVQITENSVEVEPPKATKKVEVALIEESQYENAAVVYKSFSHKLTNIFKTWWFWIKSKL